MHLHDYFAGILQTQFQFLSVPWSHHLNKLFQCEVRQWVYIITLCETACLQPKKTQDFLFVVFMFMCVCVQKCVIS